MSYSEQGDQVVLTMTRDDYSRLLMAMGQATGAALTGRGLLRIRELLELLNRLNEGNPNYERYQVERF